MQKQSLLRRLSIAAVAALVLLHPLAGESATSQARPEDEAEAPEEPLVRVTLSDGSVIVGRIVAEDDLGLRLVTPSGAETRVPRVAIASVDPVASGMETAARSQPEPGSAAEASESGRFRRSDPNLTRLMFAPTGRPLGRGRGQLTDHSIVFPGFTYGLTDNLSLMGGVSIIPGLGLGEQLFYAAPRLAFQTSRRSAFSFGALYATVDDGADRVGAGIVFAVGTFGERHASLSAGIGYGYVTDDGGFELARRPILMLGGEYQLGDSLALVSESWLILEDGFDVAEQPLGIALRFFGDRISVDAGMILVGALLDEGFPIPWLSFSYSFGDSGRSPTPPMAARLGRPLR